MSLDSTGPALAQSDLRVSAQPPSSLLSSPGGSGGADGMAPAAATPTPLAAVGSTLTFLLWLYVLWMTAVLLSVFRSQRRSLLGKLANDAQDALWRHENRILTGNQ